MKILTILFCFIVFCNVLSQPKSLKLVSNGSSDYKIIISGNASKWDSLAATELQKYIADISAVNIPIRNDSVPLGEFELIIGSNSHSGNIDKSTILNDGYTIRTVRNCIYFIGGGKKGTLNAVFTFLENYLGCRMYSSAVKVIPGKNVVEVPIINITENPAFSYRDVHYYEASQDEYSRWHKLVDEEDKKIWGLFVHTFNTLMPEEKYFKEHPEYFALRGNIRTSEEPCLSNPEVYKIMSAELRKRMEEKPDAQIWSVSQNDNDAFCQCPECSRIDEYEGSPSGSIINFVNKFAQEFPDKIISTLAYRYSRKAPQYLKPEKNVNIMLCTIEAYRTKPLEADSSSSGFVNDLAAWSEISDNILIWDYVVQFASLISPFPNFHVLQPNIKLFAKYGVDMMFQQGAGNRSGTEFGELRTYLISKLLWNPEINVDSLMNEFLTGHYGPAGMYIREYIDLMTSELIKSGANLWIYSNPIEQMKDFLKPDLIEKYNAILDKAESSVNDKDIFLERVRVARTPLMYAMLEQAKVLKAGNKGMFIRESGTGTKVNPAINSLLEEFLTYSAKTDNVYVNEKSLTSKKYVERYKAILSKSMMNPLGLNKNVNFITSPNWKYPANGETSLTDGYRGDEDHTVNWIGYEGNDMEVVIDLGENKTVKKVNADFLQNVFSWVFLPDKFEISISSDGKEFKTISESENSTPITKEELASPIYAFIKNFTCEFEPIQTRYIKVKAVNIKTCPRSHPGYPYPAWIFTDEIVIE